MREIPRAVALSARIDVNQRDFLRRGHTGQGAGGNHQEPKIGILLPVEKSPEGSALSRIVQSAEQIRLDVGEREGPKLVPEIFEKIGRARIERNRARLASNVFGSRVGEAQKRRLKRFIHLRFANDQIQMTLLDCHRGL